MRPCSLSILCVLVASTWPALAQSAPSTAPSAAPAHTIAIGDVAPSLEGLVPTQRDDTAASVVVVVHDGHVVLTRTPGLADGPLGAGVSMRARLLQGLATAAALACLAVLPDVIAIWRRGESWLGRRVPATLVGFAALAFAWAAPRFELFRWEAGD